MSIRKKISKAAALVLAVILIFSGSAFAVETEALYNEQPEIQEQGIGQEEQTENAEQDEAQGKEEISYGASTEEAQDEETETNEENETNGEKNREQEINVELENTEGISIELMEDTPLLEDLEEKEPLEAILPVQMPFALPQPEDGFVNVVIIGDQSILVPETTVNFSELASLELSEYGISPENVLGDYTALHAIIAALQKHYGTDWCKNSNNLAAENPGYISKIGDLGADGGGDWSNGTGWYSGWYAALNYNTDMEAGIAQTVVYSGDTVIFYYYVSTATTYAFFENSAMAALTQEAVQVVLKGIDVDWSSPTKGQVMAVEGATVTDGTKDYGETDNEGRLSIAFESPGSYVLTARLPDDNSNNLLTYAECKITVSENPIQIPVDKAALKALIAQAELLSYEDYTVESWIPFSVALSEAKEVDARENAAQAGVNSARNTLRAAMEALIEAAEQPADTELSVILSDISDSYAAVANHGSDYLRDWQAFGMGAYSHSRQVQNIPSFAAYSVNQVLRRTSSVATDYEASAIAVSSLGINARYVSNGQGGYCDLIGAIANWSGDSMGTINAYSNALLAYDAGGYELPKDARWTREAILSYILSAQHSDGGWGLANSSDPDVTAMTILSLAGYASDTIVKAAIDKAVAWLSGTQRPDGGFGNASESSAQVIAALSALGIDAGADARFIKEGNSALSNLLRFNTDDNHFKHISNGFVDVMATEQAFYALVAYDRMQRSGGPVNIFRFGKIEIEEPETEYIVTASTDNHLDILDTVKNPVLKVGTPNAGQTTVVLPGITTTWNGVTMEIADGTIMTVPDGFDGKIMAAGNAMGLVVPDNVNLQGTIKAGLANGTLKFSKPVRLFIPAPVGDEVGYMDSNGKIIPITAILNEDTRSEAERVITGNINDAKIKTDLGMVIWTNHFTTFLTYTAKGAGNSAATNRNVYVSVTDPNPSGAKRVFFNKKAVGFTDGMTAYDALEETGLWVESKGRGSGVYVSRVGTSQSNSLGEFDEGPLSGWMYCVNGVLYESGAGSYALNPGDDVEWLYTRNMGEDLRNNGAANRRQAAGLITLENSRTKVPGKPATDLKKIYDIVDKILSEINKKAERSDWEEIVSILKSHAVSDAKLLEIGSRIRENGGNFRLVTDLAKTALMLQIAGIDITGFEEVSLLDKICNHSDMGKQGTNGYIFSLMVMYNAGSIPANAKINVDSVIETILAAQNTDGGFSLASGSASNPDITAMTMQALAPYVHRDGAAAGVNKALAYFVAIQEEDGNFRQNEAASSETLTQLIIALASLNINPDHSAYMKNGKTLMEVLLAYRNKDGGFAHSEGGASDEIATEQAALAILAYANYFEGKPPVYVTERKTTGESIMDEDDSIAEENSGSGLRQKVLLPYDFDAASSWARPFIEKAYSLGLAQEDEFDPKRNVTGAEFMEMLLNVKGASLRGIAGEENFAQNEPVARQDIAVIIADTYGLAPGKITAADWEKAADYAKAAIGAVMESGIMSGVGGGFFDPAGIVSREMAVTVMVRLFEVYGV